jgi:two-component system chemotaxis sensor kinase CheA
MSVDLAQFHQTFFEESFEGLEAMEGGLLNLNAGAPDLDVINTIFRAAHSIKGGSATFGFSEVANFTHILETLLDEMRASKREVTDEAVELLLQSVDCLRAMLAATQAGKPIEPDEVQALHARLEELLRAKQAASAPDKPTAVHQQAASSVTSGWDILFRPHTDMLRTGNDPVRMFRELANLGDLSVVADTSGLPAFSALDPEASYLGWRLQLKGDAAHAQVAEIFDWVSEDCDLEIKPLAAANDDNPVTHAAGKSPAAISTVTANTAPLAALPQSADHRDGGSDRRAAAAGEGTSIRVAIDKVDALVNMVGELVITQSMLSQLGNAEDFDVNQIHKLRDGLVQLERNTRELQESVMRIRMLPMSFAFNRFPRLVHDLSQKLNKKIELKMSGEHTELDKTVLEKIGDPLVHLVRNSLDHGIETPDIRRAAGKPETGTILLNAYHKGGNIMIEISDDGAGLNKDKILKKARERGLVRDDEVLTDEKVYELIFLPGFSTAEVVSDVSGRGVGMDVVRRNILSLGGRIEIESRLGMGTTMRIRLPLTLAILDGMSIAVSDQIFIIPLTFIAESLQPGPQDIRGISGQGRVVQVRGEYLPLIALHELFGIETQITEPEHGILVLVEAEGSKMALFVDALVGQNQVVLKSLEANYKKIPGIAGATIMGDGRVALILDIASLVRMGRRQGGEAQREAA